MIVSVFLSSSRKGILNDRGGLMFWEDAFWLGGEGALN